MASDDPMFAERSDGASLTSDAAGASAVAPGGVPPGGLRRLLGVVLGVLVLVLAAVLWWQWPATPPLPAYEMEVRGDSDTLGGALVRAPPAAGAAQTQGDDHHPRIGKKIL